MDFVVVHSRKCFQVRSHRGVLHYPYVFDLGEEDGRVVDVLNSDVYWVSDDWGRRASVTSNPLNVPQSSWRATLDLTGEIRLLIFHRDIHAFQGTQLVI